MARGKIALADALLDGNVEMEDRFLLDMSQCLLCGSCRAQCPNKVPTEEIVAATRLRIAEQKGLSSFGKGVATVLKHQGLMDFGARVGGKLSGILFRKLPQDSGMRLRFPAPFVARDRTLPPIASKPLRDRLPEFIAGRKDQPTVLFFTGCGINYMYPESGEAMIRALNFLGVNIIIPKDQNCCGLPAVSAGAAETVETLADKNRQVFTAHDYDYIVTACASCNAGLGKIYPDMGQEFEDYQSKDKDILVFLREQGFADKLSALPKAAQRIRVTYHDPCHLRTRDMTEEPRAILKALPQVDYVEMENAGTCCGLGGTYSVYHYDTARQIGAKKAAFIAASGAELVATDCPGCMMQLQDSINHSEGKQRAVHLLELLAEALPEFE